MEGQLGPYKFRYYCGAYSKLKLTNEHDVYCLLNPHTYRNVKKTICGFIFWFAWQSRCDDKPWEVTAEKEDYCWRKPPNSQHPAFLIFFSESCEHFF